ncbi:MAG: endonuclease domain-containing protein [Pseudomonadota bacterium]
MNEEIKGHRPSPPAPLPLAGEGSNTGRCEGRTLQSPSPASGGGVRGEGQRGSAATPASASGGGVRGEGQRGSAATSASASGGGASQRPALAKALPKDILAYARDLRGQQTDAEQLLWQILRAKRFLGLKFRRQHPVGRYILDFYCGELKLAIELDGGQHAEHQAYDQDRTRFLEEQGIHVLRYWNNQMLGETEAVLETIHQEVMGRRPSPPAPLPLAGEGSNTSVDSSASPSSPSPASGGGVRGEGQRGSVATSASASGGGSQCMLGQLTPREGARS